MIQNEPPRYLSLRASSVDGPSLHSLTRTMSPFSTLSTIAAPQQQVSSDMVIAPKITSSRQISDDKICQGSAQLWKNKYEYARRDNELLKNQIDNLNQHINQLTMGNKKVENEINRHLQAISKIFMQKMVQCQQKMFQALAEEQFRIQILWRNIQRVRQSIDNCFERLKDHTQAHHWKNLLTLDNGKRISLLKFRQNVNQINEEVKKCEVESSSKSAWGKFFVPLMDSSQVALVDRLFSFAEEKTFIPDNIFYRNQTR